LLCVVAWMASLESLCNSARNSEWCRIIKTMFLTEC
jgi:hypothetical protein